MISDSDRTGLRASCSCAAAPILILDGVVACGLCRAPVFAALADECSTRALPRDAKNAAAFNRACRLGLVDGARKVGRIWICSRQAWDARERRVPSIAIAKAEVKPSNVSSALLERLGAARAPVSACDRTASGQLRRVAAGEGDDA